jgi:hypothetical protein
MAYKAEGPALDSRAVAAVPPPKNFKAPAKGPKGETPAKSEDTVTVVTAEIKLASAIKIGKPKAAGRFAKRVDDPRALRVLNGQIPYVRVQTSSHSTSGSIATAGLNTCSSLIYKVGEKVVLGHFTAEFPGGGIDPSRAVINGVTRITWSNQVAAFISQMKALDLTGTEPNGQWYFVYPYTLPTPTHPSEPMEWTAHGALYNWVTQTIRPPRQVKLATFYTWTTEEEKDPHGSARSGKGVLVVDNGRVYLEGKEI